MTNGQRGERVLLVGARLCGVLAVVLSLLTARVVLTETPYDESGALTSGEWLVALAAVVCALGWWQLSRLARR